MARPLLVLQGPVRARPLVDGAAIAKALWFWVGVAVCVGQGGKPWSQGGLSGGRWRAQAAGAVVMMGGNWEGTTDGCSQKATS